MGDVRAKAPSHGRRYIGVPCRAVTRGGKDSRRGQGRHEVEGAGQLGREDDIFSRSEIAIQD